MNWWIDRSWKMLEALIAAGLAVMVILVFANVVLRYGFNTGISLSEEVSRWLFVWVIFLGAVVAMREHGHLGTDLLLDRLPAGGKAVCFVIGHVLMLYILWLLFTGGWSLVKVNYSIRAPTSGLSMAILYVPCVLFAGLASLLVSLDLIRVLRGGRLRQLQADLPPRSS